LISLDSLRYYWWPINKNVHAVVSNENVRTLYQSVLLVLFQSRADDQTLRIDA